MYFARNKHRIKHSKCFKFYHLLILLSGDVSLNHGPSQYLLDRDNKFEPFHKSCLHFHCVNFHSFLSKIDELRYVLGHTKPAILEITESKLDSSVYDQEVNIVIIAFLRVTKIDMVEVLLACYD